MTQRLQPAATRSPRFRRLIREVMLSLTALIVVAGVAEALIRMAYLVRSSAVDVLAMPYITGGDYGPVPPWREDDGMRIADAELYWRGNPGYTQRYLNIFSPVYTDHERRSVLYSFWPSIPISLRGNPIWTVQLNSEGFRGGEFETSKPPSVFRIVCLGDSWTFGASVDQQMTYPAQLQVLLREEFPTASFQVSNLGIVGHSSFQGRKLMSRAVKLHPDVVVIGYAMNEDDWAGYEFDALNENRPGARVAGIAHAFEEASDYVTQHFQLYRLLRYWALRLKWRPDPLDVNIREFAEEVVSLEAAARGKRPEAWLQTSLRDYRDNLLQMIHDAHSAGASVMVLFPEFWQSSPYLDVLRSVAAETGVPLIDAAGVIAAAESRFQRHLETQLGLNASIGTQHGEWPARPSIGTIQAVFRVFMGAFPVASAGSISGTDPELGNLAPNAIRMYDDGTHGDEKANDSVWSLTVSLPAGASVFYVYTNSGRLGEWEGLDVPAVRRVDMPTSDIDSLVYLPVDVFGHMPFRGDPWHTDAEGNGLIAAALLERLHSEDHLRTYTQSTYRP